MGWELEGNLGLVGGAWAVVWGVGARVLPQRLGLVWIRGVGVGVGDGAGGEVG